MKHPHRRVIELLRGHFDIDDSVSDEEVVEKTKGTTAFTAAVVAHAFDEAVKAFAAVGNRLKALREHLR